MRFWKIRLFHNIVLTWTMFIGVAGIAVVMLLIAFPPSRAIYKSVVGEQCTGGTPYSAAVQSDGTSRLRIVADHANVTVSGVSQSAEVTIEGQSCVEGDTGPLVNSIIFEVSEEPDQILIYIEMPDRSWRGTYYTGSLWVNLTIQVPESITAIEIDNGIGDVAVSQVSSLDATLLRGGLGVTDVDGGIVADVERGTFDATRVGGDITVSNFDGEMRLTDVRGDIEIALPESVRERTTQYGNYEFRRIEGNVNIAVHPNGPATLDGIGGDIFIGKDGWGQLIVNDVAGNLVVNEKPGGTISINGVAGTVSLPAHLDGSGS